MQTGYRDLTESLLNQRFHANPMDVELYPRMVGIKKAVFIILVVNLSKRETVYFVG